MGALLGAWITWVERRAGRVLAGVLGLTGLLLIYTVANFGVDADNKKLLAEDVPFRQIWQAFSERFPTLDDAILVVVDAETPELAREAADALATRLREQPALFRDVFVPGAGRFFERHGLLYQDVDELDLLAEQLTRVQPVLSALTADPTLANLSRLIRLGLEQGETDLDEWPAILERFRHATVAVYAETPVWISWEEILLEGSALDPSTRRVLVLDARLDFDQLLPAGPVVDVVREAADDLGLTPDRGVRIRLTGNPVLSQEEMLGLLWDVGVAGVGSMLLVIAVLSLAFRSWRLVTAAGVTLVVGLIWTAAFATAAVGRLNLVSIAFAVLFVGLGVDFGIHLGVHYADARRRGGGHREAMDEAVRSIGASLALCTLTTAIGFYAFVPTDFRGVGELGLISGTGMFVIFALTVTLFPALLSRWLRGDVGSSPGGRPFGLAAYDAFRLHPALVCITAAVLGVVAVGLLPRIRFDSNVILLRDPGTESVQAFDDLLAESQNSPWQIDLLAPDLDAARGLAETLRELPAVEQAVTLADYVPADQEEKLEILSDLALIFDTPTSVGLPEPPPSIETQIQALADLRDYLDQPWLEESHSPFASSAALLRDELTRFLERVETDPDAEEALATLERTLLAGLPNQLDRVRDALQAEPVGLEQLPDELVRRMLAADGHARVQVFPRENVGERESLTRFVEAVRAVSPEATGLAVNIHELGVATAASLREALLLSITAIALLIWLLWRRLRDTAYALAPLLLGASLTGGAMVLLGWPFNFVNVIVIPLLLGMGVDSGVHLVNRARALGEAGQLIGTPTARAVFFSALTTIASFGTLASSSHRGLRSLGLLLVVGMVLTLVCNLVVLPALLGIRDPRRD